jgi:ribosomal-protein-alanine N-acetyltransferase
LIKVSLDHVEEIYHMLKTRNVLDYLTLKDPENLEEIRQYILFLQNQWIMNNDFTYSIQLLEKSNDPSPSSSHPIIGQITLYDLNFIHHRAEIGIWIGSPYWHHGYATEALKLIIQYAYENLNMNRLQAHIFLNNMASQKLFEKEGFQREGVVRGYIFKNGVSTDLYVYGLLRQDWLVHHGAKEISK